MFNNIFQSLGQGVLPGDSVSMSQIYTRNQLYTKTEMDTSLALKKDKTTFDTKI